MTLTNRGPSSQRPANRRPDRRRLDNQELGRHGEALVARWYEAEGYRVIDRNWRCRTGEIDLVARRGRVIAVCEVKTRSSNAFGSPLEAITAAKAARVRHLAMAWLDEHPTPGTELRLDVAGVIGNQVQVLEGVL